MEYIFLPLTSFDNIKLCDEYKDWLEKWLYELNENIEKEIISSSECVQGFIAEKILNKNDIDWQEVEKNYLRDEKNMPMSYSKEYGKRLFKFESQWKQMPVHAVYNSFWLSKQYGLDTYVYAEIIREFIQSSGWIYNPEVSNTQLRTRMRSELMMSMAMGVEILSEKGLEELEKNRIEAALASVSLTGYISAEYFRTLVLEKIERIYQIPEGIETMLKSCEAGEGFSDFSLADKVDDYMGTQKRTKYDNVIHTPLISSMANYLGKLNEDVNSYLKIRMKKYAEFLAENPMNIPSFKMRDIDYPFGTGITALEILAAASIVTKYILEGV